MTWKPFAPSQLPDSFQELIESGNDCPSCGGLGIIVSLDGASVKCSCGTWDRKRIAMVAAGARVPERYRNKAIATFQAGKNDHVRRVLREDAARYANGYKPGERGLLLIGEKGCGKTHLASGVLIEIVRRGFTGTFCNVPDLLERMRRAMHDPESEEKVSEILDTASEVDMLVLDDLGAERPTEWARDRLYLIVNRRYERVKTLVVTTNCNESELALRLGDERIVSRLHEMCDRWQNFPRQDYRFAELR